ncbi:MAG: inorganic phosphate transporter [Clostridiales bacterium]|nr:inorganic phosphate transporter [Clostridiales bacterium]
MIYLLLAAGVFMGWSLGSNDAANAFGTAVGTGVVKWRTATIIIAIAVLAGAFLAGANNIYSVNELATSNEVSASLESIEKAIADGTVDTLKLKSALKAVIVFVAAGVTVFGMTFLGFPVSANQSITGAIIGWGLFYADYGDPAIRAVNVPQIIKFVSTWLLNPLGAGIIAFVLTWIVKKFFEQKMTNIQNYDKMIKIAYILSGALSAYSIGVNSSANVTALYFDNFYGETGVAANLLTNPRLTAVIGGAAIAFGVLTYSKKVMMTVGNSIAELNQIEGFVVIISMALTILLMGETMGIPVSTSQAVVGAVVGAGLVKGPKNVHFGVFKNIGLAWLGSPTIAGLITYIIAWLTKGYFGA